MTTKEKTAGAMRQGDVIIIPCDPTQITKAHKPESLEGGRIVLAHGEVTGHAHAIRKPGPAMCLLRAEGISDRVLSLDTDALLEHEEHGAIALGPGTYIVRQQREWTGEDERQVAD